MTKLVIILR